jgi:hypothetical protein
MHTKIWSGNLRETAKTGTILRIISKRFFIKTGCEVVEWIELARHRAQ